MVQYGEPVLQQYGPTPFILGGNFPIGSVLAKIDSSIGHPRSRFSLVNISANWHAFSEVNVKRVADQHLSRFRIKIRNFENVKSGTDFGKAQPAYGRQSIRWTDFRPQVRSQNEKVRGCSKLAPIWPFEKKFC